jgi:hypothetical protein
VYVVFSIRMAHALCVEYKLEEKSYHFIIRSQVCYSTSDVAYLIVLYSFRTLQGGR